MERDTQDVVFVFGGEGAHSVETDLEVVKTSPAWENCMRALKKVGIHDGESLISHTLGKHKGPPSVRAKHSGFPLFTYTAGTSDDGDQLVLVRAVARLRR